MTAADHYQTVPITYTFATASNTSGDVAVPPYSSFTLVVFSNGLSGAGTAQLVFNADTGANYVTRFVTSPAGSATLTNTQNASAAAAIFTASATNSFLAVFKVTNVASVSKVFSYRNTIQGASAAVVPDSIIGGGEWVNTTAQITTIRMTTSANNYAAGSGFFFYGGEGL